MTAAQSIAWRLTKWQRDMLIDHVDQMRPITQSAAERITRASLEQRKLIRSFPYGASCPKSTELTLLGREVLCIVLGEAADHLVRAGYIAERPKITFPHKLPMIALQMRNAYDR